MLPCVWGPVSDTPWIGYLASGCFLSGWGGSPDACPASGTCHASTGPEDSTECGLAQKGHVTLLLGSVLMGNWDGPGSPSCPKAVTGCFPGWGSWPGDVFVQLWDG
jgi:hypothetical protein